jgi:hypothetical protein
MSPQRLGLTLVTSCCCCFLQVSFRNRVLILFDWMKAQVFGRDLSQF